MTIELFTVGREFYEPYIDGGDGGTLAAPAAFNRINALSCIKSAEHGWVGASFSCCEILTALYFGCGETNVILSKGHAAAMQYACLLGLGRLDRDVLLSYKDGPAALQAHSDRITPGILMNSGSLGMGLSKAAGMAYYRPEDRFAVIVGDGELQEGQVFEALQTISAQYLDNVTAIVDMNGFQSELEVQMVKAVADYEQMFASFGFMTFTVDGHDIDAVMEAWRNSVSQPTVIIAETTKAGGTSLLPAEGGRQPWHARVPGDELYLDIVSEQVEKSGDERLKKEFMVYSESARRRIRAEKRKARPKSGIWRRGGLRLEDLQALAGPLSKDGVRRGHSRGKGTELPATGRAFSKRIEYHLPKMKSLTVLDADLAASCRLAAMQADERFLEMGISEQDMVSFAGGLALDGKLPVVNSYAAFLKRAYEQVYVNATEGTRIIYAGHYAGLCYFTDGKTHQSLNDLAVFSSIPGLVVVEPVTLRQTEMLVDWALGAQQDPVYFRLRRTPAILDLPEHSDWRPDRPIVGDKDMLDGRCRKWFITTGTVSTQLAQDSMVKDRFSDWGIAVQSVFNGPVDLEFWEPIIRGAELIVTIEEDYAPGTLFSFVSSLAARMVDRPPRILAKTLDGFGASFRSLQECCEYFAFTPDAIEDLLDRHGL